MVSNWTVIVVGFMAGDPRVMIETVCDLFGRMDSFSARPIKVMVIDDSGGEIRLPLIPDIKECPSYMFLRERGGDPRRFNAWRECRDMIVSNPLLKWMRSHGC